MKKNEVSYKVKEENKEDFQLSVIEQTGHTSEFRIKDINDHKRRIERELTEATAQVRIHAAEMYNIEEHHPFVKDFDTKQLHTLELYTRALSEMQRGEEYIEQRKKALAEYAELEPEIYGQCKFDVSDIFEVKVPDLEEPKAKED